MGKSTNTDRLLECGPIAVHRLVTVILASFFSGSAFAQDGESSRQPTQEVKTTDATSSDAETPAFFRLDYSGDIWERPALSGDWGGARNALAEQGISFELNLEQFVQFNAHGGRDTNHGVSYSGSWDLNLKLDTQRMGLWPGGLIELRAESQFGDPINRKVGALVNDDALYPSPEDHGVMLPVFTYTQFLSDGLAVIVGKLDGANSDENEFAWIYGNNFLNTNFRWNPITGRTSPYSTLGVGAFIFGDWGQWSIAAYDTEGLPDETGFDTVFEGGTSFSTELRLNVRPFDLPGHQLFGFVYSDKSFLSLEQDARTGIRLPRNPLLNLLLLGLAAERESGSWAFYYNFDQYLHTEDADPAQGLGVFGRFGISDGDANPIGAFYSIGLGAKGLIPERDHDTCGLGYYYTDFEGSIPERLDLSSTQGIELFYRIEVTPWMHITPDLQVIIDPEGSSDRDVAIVGGMRLEMVL